MNEACAVSAFAPGVAIGVVTKAARHSRVAFRIDAVSIMVLPFKFNVVGVHESSVRGFSQVGV